MSSDLKNEIEKTKEEFLEVDRPVQSQESLKRRVDVYTAEYPGIPAVKKIQK